MSIVKELAERVSIKRTYADHGDACATAHAMELIGERWSYPVIRELMLAPKRFGELLLSVRGITPAVLTSRLRQLEMAGLLSRIMLPAPARVAAYELTEWGRGLESIMRELGRWAQGSPTRITEGAGLTPDATIQSMLTMAPLEPPREPIELSLYLVDSRLPNDSGYEYRVSWTERGLTAERGVNSQARAKVHADSSTWARILYEDVALDDEAVRIEGDRSEVTRFVAKFSSTR